MALKTCRACTRRISENDGSCSNAHDVASSQLFPTHDVLSRNLDTPLAVLQQKISNELQQRAVFVYIVKTVKVRNGKFAQTGCAPNFQGGYISLCTCKHQARASAPPKNCRGPDQSNPWKDVWVAGLCSPDQVRPRALFYLMLVGQTFESHTACWNGLSAPSAKSAHRHPFGDIYEPLPGPGDAPWSATSYMDHLPGHCHNPTDRISDIEVSYYGRHPRLLVGDPKRSFLWSAPHVTLLPRADDDWGSATIGSFRNSAVSFRRYAEYRVSGKMVRTISRIALTVFSETSKRRGRTGTSHFESVKFRSDPDPAPQD